MKLFVISSLFCTLVAFTVSAAECPIGHIPMVAVLSVSSADLDRMSLPAEQRLLAEEKSKALQARDVELEAAYRNATADLGMLLSSAWPDRSKADDLLSRVHETISELNQLRMEYVFEMTDLLRAENLRKIRTRAPRWRPSCDQAIPIPKMRAELTAAEKKILGLTDDEIKYLAEFSRREAYFHSEQKDLSLRLRQAFKARDIDRPLAKSLMAGLADNIKQQATNRMDRFFYAEHVLLSPERVMKVKAFRAKHAKRVKSPKPKVQK